MPSTADTIEVLQLKQSSKKKKVNQKVDRICNRVKERKWVSHVNVN